MTQPATIAAVRALRQDLLRLRNAWEESQASRERDAIYSYLTAVFNLVAWWTAEARALERAHWALRLRSTGHTATATLKLTYDLHKNQWKRQYSS
jgi:hypothetical protein